MHTLTLPRCRPPLALRQLGKIRRRWRRLALLSVARRQRTRHTQRICFNKLRDVLIRVIIDVTMEAALKGTVLRVVLNQLYRSYLHVAYGWKRAGAPNAYTYRHSLAALYLLD